MVCYMKAREAADCRRPLVPASAQVRVKARIRTTVLKGTAAAFAAAMMLAASSGSNKRLLTRSFAVWPGNGVRSMMLANRETEPKLVPLWGQICDEYQEKNA